MLDAHYKTVASTQNINGKHRSPEFIMFCALTGIGVFITVFLQVFFQILAHAQDTGSGYTSPPVYPARTSPMSKVTLAIGTCAGQWADAYVKAKALVAQMTLVEKVCPRDCDLCRSI